MALIEKLMGTEEPRKFINSYLSHIDDNFFYVLEMLKEQAKKSGRQDLYQGYAKVGALVEDVMEENMPRGIVFMRRLMRVETHDETALHDLLDEYAALVNPDLIQMIDATLESASEMQAEPGQEEVSEHLTWLRTAIIKAHPELATDAVVSSPAAGAEPSAASEKPTTEMVDGEERTPSGLIIAKH